LPVVERVLRWYEPYIDDHGTLSDVPEWNLIDWSSVFSSGRSSLITGLWARGLAEYAEMADWLGNTASAAWARGLWEQAGHGYEDFWDPARGSYIDHIVAGERQPAMSQASGAVAIVSGLAPQDRWAGIVDVITDPPRLVIRSWIGGEDGGYDMTKIVEHSQGIYRIDWDVDREVVLAEPFFSYVVHDAVAAAGRAERLPELLRRWSVCTTASTPSASAGDGAHPSMPGAPHRPRTSSGTCSASPPLNRDTAPSGSRPGRAPSNA
jgi:alpha-L-rhamnosidase